MFNAHTNLARAGGSPDCAMTETENIDDIVKRLCTMEAPLNERLDMFSAVLRAREPEFANAYDDLARRLAMAGQDRRRPVLAMSCPPSCCRTRT